MAAIRGDFPSALAGYLEQTQSRTHEKRVILKNLKNAGVIFGAGMTQTKEGRFEIAHLLKRRLKIAAP